MGGLFVSMSLEALSILQKISTKFDDAEVSGSITTQNFVPFGEATAGSAVELDVSGGHCTLGIQVTGTYTGALSIQGTLNGVDWVTFGGVPFLNAGTGAYSSTTASAAKGIFNVEVSAMRKVRLTSLAAVTGAAAVTLRASPCTSLVGIDASLPAGTNSIGVVDTELPAAAALSDSIANPSTPVVGAGNLQFNGATFERVRGNHTIIPDASAARTATGNGTAVVNYSGRSLLFFINVTAVSGTSPTLALKLQWSPDNGTTWLDLPGAALVANLTAVGTAYIAVLPHSIPAPTSPSAACIHPVPRQIRAAWTIGGTSPSFTFSTAATLLN